MHELGIAMSIVEAAVESADGAPVRRIVVVVGELTAVMPDALRFCFAAAATDTVVAGAELEIREVRAVARCEACSARLSDGMRAFCNCGSAELVWESGRELRVVELEVEVESCA